MSRTRHDETKTSLVWDGEYRDVATGTKHGAYSGRILRKSGAISQRRAFGNVNILKS